MLLRLSLIVGLFFISLGVHANCEGTEYTNPTEFSKVLTHVKSLREYKAFEKGVKKAGLKVVRLDYAHDEKGTLDGRCYWSITFYEDHPDHVHRWNTFYVSPNGKRILVGDITGGDPKTLKQWRAQNKKWGREWGKKQKVQKKIPQNEPDPVIQESPDTELETQER